MKKDFSGVARMHKPITKQDLTGSPSGPVKTYFLEGAELDYYRNMKPPAKYGSVNTLGAQLKSKGVR